MGYFVPEKDLLLLLGPDAAIFVKKFKKLASRLFQHGISPGLQIAQIGEDTFFKLFGIQYSSTKLLETERQSLYNVCASDEEATPPIDTANFVSIAEF